MTCLLPIRWPVALLLTLALAATTPNAWAASSPARHVPPAAKQVPPQGTVTPPLIAGGKWPVFTIAGNFNPKAITNPRVGALWVVDTKGRPKDIRLDKSSGSKPVDNAIIAYVGRLRFIPATKNNKPVDASMSLPFDLSAGKG